MHVDMAASIASATRLQDLLQLSDEELLIKRVIRVAFQWFGVERKDFVDMVLDSCRRVWCILVMVDHDAEKVRAITMSSISPVIHFGIDLSPLLSESAYLRGKVCHY